MNGIRGKSHQGCEFQAEGKSGLGKRTQEHACQVQGIFECFLYSLVLLRPSFVQTGEQVALSI